MPDLRDTRRKIKLGLIGLACVDVLAVAALISPLIGSAASRRQQISDLRQELQTKSKQVEPLRGMDKKVDLASQQIAAFYKDRIADRDSAISERLDKVANEHGVKIVQARYKSDDPEQAGLVPVVIDADLSGDYVQVAKFINALERDKMFFIVDSVNLASEQNGPVKLQMRLETFHKAGA
jgi:type IV pilus assembly protein PilO